MERLTFEGKFCDIACCPKTPGGSFCEDGYCSQRKIWERLKAYEDTGLSPEEIEALPEAWMEKVKELDSGALVRLPCKIGDHAWAIRNVRGCKRAMLGVVAEMSYTNEMRLMVRVNGIGRGEVGKTIFLTQEEALAALEKEKTP